MTTCSELSLLLRNMDQVFPPARMLYWAHRHSALLSIPSYLFSVSLCSLSTFLPPLLLALLHTLFISFLLSSLSFLPFSPSPMSPFSFPLTSWMWHNRHFPAYQKIALRWRHNLMGRQRRKQKLYSNLIITSMGDKRRFPDTKRSQADGGRLSLWNPSALTVSPTPRAF